MASFTLIVTCKGRLAHLRETLPRFLQQADTQVIVVDYSCPDQCGAYVERHHPAATVVRVPGQRWFNLAAARNAGARGAAAPHLLFCDADTLLSANFTQLIAQLVKPRTFLTFQASKGNSLGGSSVVAAQDFTSVQGFDEVFVGYGGEDLDFYWRLSRMGLTRYVCDPTEAITSIEHGPQLRGVHYPTSDIRKSFLQARAYRLVKETVLGLTFTGELPLAQRRKLWGEVAAALADDRFEIRVRLPGNSTSGFLNEWTWKRDVVVSFGKKEGESSSGPGIKRR
jgi:glycosyltransferase involved in cell wall biosynthesis